MEDGGDGRLERLYLAASPHKYLPNMVYLGEAEPHKSHGHRLTHEETTGKCLLLYEWSVLGPNLRLIGKNLKASKQNYLHLQKNNGSP